MEWISVEERRPNEYPEKYLAAIRDKYSNTLYVDIMWYEKDWWWDGKSTDDYEVAYWMPLPAPPEE